MAKTKTKTKTKSKAKDKQKQEEKQAEKLLKEFTERNYTDVIEVKDKDEDGNEVTHKLYYDYEQLDYNRVKSAELPFSSYESLMKKPPQNVDDLDHANMQEFQLRGFAAILFERDKDGDIKPYKPDMQANKVYHLMQKIRGREMINRLNQIKMAFFLETGIVPAELTELFTSTGKLLMEENKGLIKELVEEITSSKSNLNKKDTRKLLEQIFSQL